ncbi:hypothetical protein LPJ64_005919, partial [Coemansia asiatica]
TVTATANYAPSPLALHKGLSCPLINHGALSCPSGQGNKSSYYLECVWGKVISINCPAGTVCQNTSPSKGSVICDRPKK